MQAARTTSGQRDSGAWAAIAEGATTRRLRRNEVIFRPGDPAGDLYAVQFGRVAIVRQAPDGRECFVSLLGKGDLFGVSGLFDEAVRSEQARAVVPTSVLVMAYGPVRRVLHERPALLWSMGQHLTRRLNEARGMSADRVFLDLAARTAKSILDLAGDADEFDLPVTQEELAAVVGASRERVNKAIASFVRLGWLEQKGRHYTVLDRDQLELRVDG